MSTGSLIDKWRKCDNKPILFANNLNIISTTYFPFICSTCLGEYLAPGQEAPREAPEVVVDVVFVGEGLGLGAAAEQEPLPRHLHVARAEHPLDQSEVRIDVR